MLGFKNFLMEEDGVDRCGVDRNCCVVQEKTDNAGF